MATSDFRSPPRGSRRGTLDISALLANIGSVFVWDDGATSSENLFGTFAELYAALTSAPSGPKFVRVRGANTIPAGAYNLRDVTFLGEGPTGTDSIIVAAGVTISQAPIFEGLTVAFNNAAPVFTTGAVLVFKRCLTYAADAVLDGGTLLLEDTFLGGTGFGGGAGAFAEASDTGAGTDSLAVQLVGGSHVGDDAFDGAAGSTLGVAHLSLSAALGAQPNFAGTITRTTGQAGIDGANYDDANRAINATTNGRFGPWRWSTLGADEDVSPVADRTYYVITETTNHALTLPTSPPAGFSFGVKVGAAVTANVTITPGGSDEMEVAAVPGTTANAARSFAGTGGHSIRFEWSGSAWWEVPDHDAHRQRRAVLTPAAEVSDVISIGVQIVDGHGNAVAEAVDVLFDLQIDSLINDAGFVLAATVGTEQSTTAQPRLLVTTNGSGVATLNAADTATGQAQACHLFATPFPGAGRVGVPTRAAFAFTA